MAHGYSPDYPTSKHPPKCPTCGQRLPSDHVMIAVDPGAMQRAKSKGKGRVAKRGVSGRQYSKIEDNVRSQM